ncbi:hypothetical protein [Flagellimonas sp.]|uniref:hypothetical protein n=1 Tax=Flagellimonas sp. TaxID=2058762 RepID=UPI003BAF8BB0
MKSNDGYLDSLYIKGLLSLKILLYSPKILLRFIVLLIKRKRLKLHFFKADARYSVHGTLNQLSWTVENAIFITLKNSSKLFFESNELVFRVDHERTKFNITCYGVGNKIRATTSIRVVRMKVNDFNEVTLRKQNQIKEYNEIDLVPCRIKVRYNPFKPILTKVQFKIRNRELKSMEHTELNQQLCQLYKMNSEQKITELGKTITNQS